MYRTIALLVLALSVTAIGTAQAQTSDRAYCESLYALWERYAAPRGEGRSPGGLDTFGAVEQCRRGDTAAGIATLEKKLRDNRFTLPQR